MIRPNQDSSLFQDSSLNRTPGEKFYISGYKGPNQILQDFSDRVRNLIYVVKFSYPEGEIVTRTSSLWWTVRKYVTLGKSTYVPIGKTNSNLTYGVRNKTEHDRLVQILKHIGAILLERLHKQQQVILQKKLKKTRASYIL